LPLVFVRNEDTFSTKIYPIFIPELHEDYRSQDRAKFLAASFSDYTSLGLSKYLFCSVTQGVKSLANKNSFDDYVNDTGECSDRMRISLEKARILYQETDNAALWGSILAPGAALPRAFRITNHKALKLSKMSRKVFRNLYRRPTKINKSVPLKRRA
jgi:hypothetical protein